MNDSEKIEEILNKISLMEETLNSLEKDVGRLNISRLCICGFPMSNSGDLWHCINEACCNYNPKFK